MEILLTDIRSGRASFDPGVDYSAWDVVETDVTDVLHDPNLKQGLAYHFSRMGALIKLNELYLNYSIGPESALTSAERVRSALFMHLQQELEALTIEAKRLIEKITPQA